MNQSNHHNPRTPPTADATHTPPAAPNSSCSAAATSTVTASSRQSTVSAAWAAACGSSADGHAAGSDRRRGHTCRRPPQLPSARFVGTRGALEPTESLCMRVRNRQRLHPAACATALVVAVHRGRRAQVRGRRRPVPRPRRHRAATLQLLTGVFQVQNASRVGHGTVVQPPARRQRRWHGGSGNALANNERVRGLCVFCLVGGEGFGGNENGKRGGR